MLASETGSPVLASLTTPESCPVVPAHAVPKTKMALAMRMAAPRTKLSRGRRNMFASSVDPPNCQTEGFIPEQIGPQPFDLDLSVRPRSRGAQPFLDPCPGGHPSPGLRRISTYRLCRA